MAATEAVTVLRPEVFLECVDDAGEPDHLRCSGLTCTCLTCPSLICFSLGCPQVMLNPLISVLMRSMAWCLV